MRQGMLQNPQQPPKKNNTGWHPLNLWYRISAPDEELQDDQHDIIRSGRIASILLLVSFVVSIAFIPAAITSDGMHVVLPVAVLAVVTCIAIPFNKRGHITIVGALFVFAIDFALIFSLLTYPNFTLPLNALPIYDLFVISDIVAVSLLANRSILYISLFHAVFMCADIVLQPHSPELHALVNETNYSFMVRPLTIQLVVGVLMYLWVRNTLKALERANKAELVAQLERQISEQKKDLDTGVQQLLHTMVQAANGDLSVRVPVVRDNALWQINNALNTLLARQQRSSQSEQQLHQLRAELRRLHYDIQEAKRKQQIIHTMPGGTEVDHLASELVGHYLLNTPREIKRK